MRRAALAALALLVPSAGLAGTRYLAFGDSITAGTSDEQRLGGYPGRLQTLLRAKGQPLAVVENHGLSGETTTEALSRIDGVVANGGDCLLLMEGTNDVYWLASPESITFNLSQLADRATAHGLETVHATVIPQVPTAQSDPGNVITSQLAARIRQLAAAHKRRIADPFQVFYGTPNVFRDYYVQEPTDPVGHPNARGYDLLAQTFVDPLVAPRPSALLEVVDPTQDDSVGKPFRVSGWAIDPGAPSGTGIDRVEVWAFPLGSLNPLFLGAASLGESRPEVAASYGDRFLRCGFTLLVTNPPPAGYYTLYVTARSTRTGSFDAVREVVLDINVNPLHVVIDSPRPNQPLAVPFEITGWAIDTSVPFGTGIDAVEVWAYSRRSGVPVALGSATMGIPRPDIGASYGNRFTNSGYRLRVTTTMAHGAWDVYAYYRSSLTRAVVAVRPLPLQLGDMPSVWNSFFAVDPRETPCVGDFNGDGKTDIITFTRDNPLAYGDVYVSLSDGKSFGANQKWHDWFAISHGETVLVGDYNGDGKDDIATWLGTTTKQVYVAPSRGTGMEPATVWLDSLGYNDGDVILPGDVDGDGKDDLVLFNRKMGKVYVARSVGSRFSVVRLWHQFFAVSTYERPAVGDVNGDGRADIITFGTNSPTAFGDVYVALASGNMFGDSVSSIKWHDFFAIDPAQTIRIGDRNGDGKADFFTFLPAPYGQVYTVLSQGNAMGPNDLVAEWAVPPPQASQFYVGDANGDGKADVIEFNQLEGWAAVQLTP